MEAVVEWQEMPNEEAEFHSLRACQETAEACLKCKDPTLEDMEPETEHQEKMDTWIMDPKDGRKERTACQEATEANPEKMEAAVHSLRACRKEMMACQETMEAHLGCEEPTSVDMGSEFT
jgi:hypothetical protein